MSSTTTYKTRLCENFSKGTCAYGDKCNFAHGDAELVKRERPVSERPPKTRFCASFKETGTCSYGVRCNFAHSESELVKKCNNCGELGHVFKNCPVKKCSFCKESGHLITDCKEKKKLECSYCGEKGHTYTHCENKQHYKYFV
jgi:hypothetical protein